MAHNKNTQDSLYIMVDNPDNRKRFVVTFEKNENEKETIVLMIPQTLTFSGFLGLLISKFKLDSSSRAHIRVKTNGSTRIKSLTNTYNNQLIEFYLSELEDEDPEDKNKLSESEETEKELKEKKDKSILEESYLPLYTKREHNKSKFYRRIISKLQYKEGDIYKVIVGESYPYRCKVIIGHLEKDSRIYLYFTEIINNSNENGTDNNNDDDISYSFDVTIQLSRLDKNAPQKREDVIKILENQYKLDKFDMVGAILDVEIYYRKEFFTTPNFGTLDKCVNLFLDLEKISTVSQNNLIRECYKSIEKVSNYYDIPYSISRKLLFQSDWNEKQVISLPHIKEQNRNIIRSFSFPHKSSDIGLYIFNMINDNRDEEVECSICYCDYTKADMIELVCGHSFCKNCLTHYFKTSVNDGNGGSSPISCPSNSCLNKCIDEVTIESLLEPKMKLIALKNFVKDVLYLTPNNYQCPYENCNRLVMGLKSTHKYIPYVSCSDHEPFCLFCKKKGYHWPMPCSKADYEDHDLFSFRWIIANTTICSKCQYPIERNQGCNHMTCSRCRHQFCYLCGGDYVGHSSCGIGKEKKNNLFFKAISGKSSINSSFLKEFLEMQPFSSKDPIINHVYKSFITMITDKSFANKQHLKLLESAVFFLHSHSISRKQSESDHLMNACQKVIKKLLRPDIYINKSSGLILYLKNNLGPSAVTLSATICQNGSKKSFGKLFVNSQFHDFKQEIVNLLNKKIPSDQAEYDAKKIRLFSLYGGQIKASSEIINNEAIFVTSSIHEQFIEPQIPTLTPEEIEEAKKQIELENQNRVIVREGQKEKNFTQLQPKNKRKNDKSKLKENLENQLKLQEKLKLDQGNLGNPNVSLYTDEIRDQYFHYRYSLLDSDNDDDDDNDDEYEQYDEKDLIDHIPTTTTTTTINTSEDEKTIDGEDEFVNIDSNSSSSEFEDGDEDLLEIKRSLELEDKELEKERELILQEEKQIGLVFKVLEMYQDEDFGLDFDKVFSVCSDAKNLSQAIKRMTLYLDENYYSNQYGITQTHLLIKERLSFTFPNLSLTVIDRAIKESNYNHDKAKSWIFNKFQKQQKKKFNQLSKNVQQQQPKPEEPQQQKQPSQIIRKINTSEQFEIYSDNEDSYDIDDAENYITEKIYNDKVSKFH
ncbi:hypothetical protein RB653_005333 [Dictyostelium firmibasis]|uniref:RBR-type E3 ubiquitin transferase n=1 Tax=Dictyostelium firmibasis TaxID=79012 RepID=A0AAN7U9L4_9MYCE